MTIPQDQVPQVAQGQVATPNTAPAVTPTQSQVKSCTKCGKQFRIIKQELEFLNSKGLSFPTMCPSCRQERRMSLRNPRQLIRANCDKCGKEIITTPKYDSRIQVYCDDCFKNYLNTVDPIIK